MHRVADREYPQLERSTVEGYTIEKEWLQERVSPDEAGELKRYAQPGDEFWTFDEPAPPGVNAGALGIALVRNGVPIRTILTGIH